MTRAQQIKYWTGTALATVAIAYFLARFLAARQPDFAKICHERKLVATSKSADPVDLAVVWDRNYYDNQGFIEGIDIAIDYLNLHGGLLGRPVTYTQYSEANTLKTARKIALNTRHSVVIGHNDSDTSIPASNTYNRAGLLYISPFATNPLLTAYGYPLVLRPQVQDEHAEKNFLKLLDHLQVRKIAIVSRLHHYMMVYHRYREKEAIGHGIRVVFSQSYSETKSDVPMLAYQINSSGVDCLLLIDELPQAATLIRHIRKQGGTFPIIGTDNFETGVDLNSLIEERLLNSGRILLITYIRELNQAKADLTWPPAEYFFQEIVRRQISPAAYDFICTSFDNVMLYAQGVQRAQSFNPIAVTAAIKFGPPSQGVFGPYRIGLNGDAIGLNFVFKEYKNGAFHEFTID